MIKGLEALKRMGEKVLYSEYAEYPKVKGLADYETVKKELKALEIIKNKKVDVDYLDECIRTEAFHLSAYNFSSSQKLTQEEYDLLKEVLL